MISGKGTVFTCDSSTAGVTTYEFKKGGQVIATVTDPNNQYSISSASVDNNGDYSCSALIDDVSSDDSSVVTLEGEKYMFDIKRKSLNSRHMLCCCSVICLMLLLMFACC